MDEAAAILRLNFLERDALLKNGYVCMDGRHEEIKVAKLALEKQIPKKPVKVITTHIPIFSGEEYETYSHECPVCGVDVDNHYCPNCGQRLEW